MVSYFKKDQHSKLFNYFVKKIRFRCSKEVGIIMFTAGQFDWYPCIIGMPTCGSVVVY